MEAISHDGSRDLIITISCKLIAIKSSVLFRTWLQANLSPPTNPNQLIYLMSCNHVFSHLLVDPTVLLTEEHVAKPRLFLEAVVELERINYLKESSVTSVSSRAPDLGTSKTGSK
jgi:hypothetical protein